jgi:hypothetical protein
MAAERTGRGAGRRSISGARDEFGGVVRASGELVLVGERRLERCFTQRSRQDWEEWCGCYDKMGELASRMPTLQTN